MAVTVKIIIIWDVMPYSLQHASISLVFLKWKQHIPLTDHYISIRLQADISEDCNFLIRILTLFSFSMPLLSRGLSCQCGGKKWQGVRTIQNKQFCWRPTTIPEIWPGCVTRITPEWLLWQAYFYVPVGKWEVSHPVLQWKDQLISLAMGLCGPFLFMKDKKESALYSW